MKRLTNFLVLWIIGFVLLGILPKARANAMADEAALTLIQRILKDPMMVDKAHTAEVVFHNEPEKPWRKYILRKPDGLGTLPLGACSTIPRPGGTFDVLIQLLGDGAEVDEQPEWDKLQPQWDAFVARYWPGLERVGDWHRQILRWTPSRGEFTIRYALKDHGAEMFRVMLNIRLANGRIGGVSTIDARPYLLWQKVPPPPAREKILVAVKEAIAQKLGEGKVKALQVDSIYRYPEIGNKGVYFQELINLFVDTVDGKKLTVLCSYEENDGKIYNLNIADKPEIDDLSRSSLTQIQDTKPAWSSDGKQLYFITTRNTKGFPWWRRGTLEYSIGRWQAEPQHSEVSIVDPIKANKGNYGLYDASSPAPSGRYLAGGFGSDQHLFVLDLREGLFYLPQRNPKWREALVKKWRLPSNQLSDDLPWTTKGVAWLPDEDTLLLAMPFAWPDDDLFLARHEKGKPPHVWDLVPLDADRGEAIWPYLGQSGQFVGYGHSVPQTREEIKADKPLQWQLVVADLDAATAKLSQQRRLDLDSEPTSISWDSKAEQWLVVTKTQMLRIKDTGGQLTATPVGALRWNQIELHPTSAAVALQGDKIAVAAELLQPQIYEKAGAVVAATIFLWDGKSQQVQPLFEPSLNGLPRYIFPATGSPWARISGDVKKFGLQGIADPTLLSEQAGNSIK